MEARCIPGAAPRGLDPRRRARPLEHREPLRSLLHDKVRRLGHRAGSLATDCRGPRRLAHSREPLGPSWLHRPPDSSRRRVLMRYGPAGDLAPATPRLITHFAGVLLAVFGVCRSGGTYENSRRDFQLSFRGGPRGDGPRERGTTARKYPATDA